MSKPVKYLVQGQNKFTKWGTFLLAKDGREALSRGRKLFPNATTVSACRWDDPEDEIVEAVGGSSMRLEKEVPTACNEVLEA